MGIYMLAVAIETLDYLLARQTKRSLQFVFALQKKLADRDIKARSASSQIKPGPISRSSSKPRFTSTSTDCRRSDWDRMKLATSTYWIDQSGRSDRVKSVKWRISRRSWRTRARAFYYHHHHHVGRSVCTRNRRRHHHPSLRPCRPRAQAVSRQLLVVSVKRTRDGGIRPSGRNPGSYGVQLLPPARSTGSSWT